MIKLLPIFNEVILIPNQKLAVTHYPHTHPNAYKFSLRGFPNKIWINKRKNYWEINDVLDGGGL